jgi:hypothetical protein
MLAYKVPELRLTHMHTHTHTMAAALQHWNDIDTSDPLDREALACAVFSSLVALFMDIDRTSVSVAVPVVCLLGFRGNKRVIKTSDKPIVITLLQHLILDHDENAEFFLVCLVVFMLGGAGGNSLFRHMDMPLITDFCINLNSMSQSDCRAACQFDQDEKKQIVTLLPFPDFFITDQQDRVHLLEAFVIFCRRLAYPNRWCDLHKEFGRSTSALSRIFKLLLHMIVSRVHSKVAFHPLEQQRYDISASALFKGRRCQAQNSCRD